jgi:hypothetical protein
MFLRELITSCEVHVVMDRYEVYHLADFAVGMWYQI